MIHRCHDLETFSLQVDLAENPARPVYETAPRHSDRTQNIEDDMNSTFTILVVEDDVLIRDYVSSVLKAAGYDVTSAANVADALEVLNGCFKPNLLFTDVYMGAGLNGIELARNARQMFPDLKILFTSGFMPATERDQMPEGAQVLQKPYRKKDCLAKVMAMLEGV